MKNRRLLLSTCSLGLSLGLALGLSARLLGQGPGPQVNVTTGMYYFEPFSVQAWAEATGNGGFPVVYIDGTLSGPGGNDYHWDQAISHASIDLMSWYEPASTYVLSVFACADWLDGWYDCKFDNDTLTTPGACTHT